MVTDSWGAYPGAAEAAGVSHLTVNHKKEFKNPITGACTNNCEGIHSVIKKMPKPNLIDCRTLVKREIRII